VWYNIRLSVNNKLLVNSFGETMARSYKKAVFKSDSSYKQFAKNQANRRVRRTAGVPEYGGHKKVYNSWDIDDWIFDMRFGTGRGLPKGAKKTRSGWVIPK